MDALKAPDGKIRVLINALHSKSGGGMTYLSNVVPALAAEGGIELHVALHENQLNRYEWLVDHANLHVFDFPDRMATTLLWEQFALPVVARMMRADVVYSPANFGPLLLRNGVVLLANSLAVAAMEVRLGKILYWAALTVMTALSVIAARRVAGVSHYAVDGVLRGPLRLLRRKSDVIHLGVAPQFSPAPVVRGSNLLAVGDIYIQKNYHTLLRSFARLAERHPDLTLDIAGREVDSHYAAGLRRLVADLGLQERVSFLGYATPEQLCERYRRCRVFVFPSTVETFGIPLIEAMACGAPIAGSDRAAMREVAADNMAYFDPEDVDSMAGVIDALLHDEARRADLSQRAVERAALFSWRHHAERIAAVLQLAAR